MCTVDIAIQDYPQITHTLENENIRMKFILGGDPNFSFPDKNIKLVIVSISALYLLYICPHVI